jgi:membrane-bound lytic murein transglycosylase F
MSTLRVRHDRGAAQHSYLIPPTACLIAALLALACNREPAPPPPAQPAAPPPAATPKAALPKPSDAAPAKSPTIAPIDHDLDAIRTAGTLNVLFTFNSTGYFLYRGETMGYEYELLSLFARDAKLHLKPIVVRDSRELFDRLDRGDGDLVAAQLAAPAGASSASSPAAPVAFTDALYQTAPVVVQRSPKGSEVTPSVAKALAREEKETAPAAIEVRARLVSTPAELAGQRLHMPKTSPYWQRLVELNDELTQDVEVVEVDESSDHLIQRLSEGEIAFTVAAENVAALKTGEYANLIIKPAIGPPQPVVWAVRRNAPQLLSALNQWLAAKRKAGLLAVLYRKYFLDRRGFNTRWLSPYLASETGTLSPFDALFREYAKIPGWDWRLVASQAFQESRFNPRARSWAGAIGLMQIMPATARQLHANPADTRQAVEAACRYLWQFDDYWKESIADEDERVKFILASYNVGLGHVQDAVRLAKKNGDDATVWQNVAYWLIRKSKRSVYNDPVVKHGFARGTEPVAYVDQILARFDNYKEFVSGGQAPSPVQPEVVQPSP